MMAESDPVNLTLQKANEGNDDENEIKGKAMTTGKSDPSIDQNKARHLLEGKCIIDRKKHMLAVTPEGLQLKPFCSSNSSSSQDPTVTKTKSDEVQISWRDVLGCEQSSKSSSELKIHFIEHKTDLRLRRNTITIDLPLSEEDSIDNWVEVIQGKLQEIIGRPKSLFVLMNPIGGGGKAKKIYNQQVAPLFELAKIEATVVETERSKHTIDICENQDFSGYDGLVVVGGDGSVQEVLQGLVIQAQKQAGVDVNDMQAELARPTIPIGAIPGGTGNGFAGWLSGVNDVETSTLNIVRGEIHHGVTQAVYCNGKFVCVSALMMSYGNITDMMYQSEQRRWMGRLRYLYGILESMFRGKRKFECELEFLVPDVQTESSVDEKNVAGAGNGAEIEEKGLKAEESNEKHTAYKWVKHDNGGRPYTNISCMGIEMKDTGRVNLIPNYFCQSLSWTIDQDSSAFTFLKFVMFSQMGKRVDPPANISVMKNVKGMRFKLLREQADTEGNSEVPRQSAQAREMELLLSIAGEMVRLEKPEAQIRLIPDFTPVFGPLLVTQDNRSS